LAHDLSDRRFDPTVGPVVSIWHLSVARRGRPPVAAEVLDVTHEVGWRTHVKRLPPQHVG